MSSLEAELTFAELTQIIESSLPPSSCSSSNTSAAFDVEQQVNAIRQVSFFVYVWLHKQNRFGAESPLIIYAEAKEIEERCKFIVRNLAEWKDTIRSLQNQDPVEWELLRFQMEKAVRRYHADFDDALQEALLKIHNIIKRLPSDDVATSYPLIDTFIQNSAQYQSIYDYGSPFYAYAKVVARNELIGQLRKAQRRPVYHLPIEEIHNAKALSYAEPNMSESRDEREQNVIRQLTVDMELLLQTLQQLSPKQQQTTLPTLATREQFWRVIGITGVRPPDRLSQYRAMSSDAELAVALDMTENNLRVHRQHAKKRIQLKEPMLGELYERLMAKHEPTKSV